MILRRPRTTIVDVSSVLNNLWVVCQSVLLCVIVLLFDNLIFDTVLYVKLKKIH